MSHESIQNRCPACGTASLIVGSEGWLVCGYLECPDPTMVDRVLATVDECRLERDRARRRVLQLDELLRPFADADADVPEPTPVDQSMGTEGRRM